MVVVIVGVAGYVFRCSGVDFLLCDQAFSYGQGLQGSDPSSIVAGWVFFVLGSGNYRRQRGAEFMPFVEALFAEYDRKAESAGLPRRLKNQRSVFSGQDDAGFHPGDLPAGLWSHAGLTLKEFQFWPHRSSSRV